MIVFQVKIGELLVGGKVNPYEFVALGIEAGETGHLAQVYFLQNGAGQVESFDEAEVDLVVDVILQL